MWIVYVIYTQFSSLCGKLCNVRDVAVLSNCFSLLAYETPDLRAMEMVVHSCGNVLADRSLLSLHGVLSKSLVPALIVNVY